MDNLIIEKIAPRDGRFVHTPVSIEKNLGLWFDRSGSARDSEKTQALRILENYGIVEVLEGNGNFYSPQTGWLELKPGMAVWLFPDIPHFYQAEKVWLTRWIVFNGPLMKRFRTSDCLSPENPVVTDCHEIIDNAFLNIKRDITESDKKGAVSNFELLISLITNLHSFKDSKLSLSNRRISEIKEYIHKNCCSNFSPEEVADTFDISYSHLRKIFRGETGLSIKDFITKERITEAKTLLLDTTLPPKQIANTVGYEDYLYFMRVFKKVEGMTAGEYRSLKSY
ncbi:MAG: AraC family transcriptional regulator, partial [Planctomycetota bacterium]